MKCSFMGCVEEKELYNIKFQAQQAGIAQEPEWRCVYHIPKNITFPVSLHGRENWKKADRKQGQ